MLVLGDTNCCIAAVMAKRMRIPIYHMEAGNRCFDENVPEETNRRLVDHVADFNLVYTEHARRNLLAEGLHPRRILVTGSPMREVLEHFRDQIEASDVLEPPRARPRASTSWSARTGRRTSTHPERLRMLLDCLVAVRERWGKRVVVSTHPRTRKRLEALDRDLELDGIDFMEPVRFPRLQPTPDRGGLCPLRLRHDLGGVIDPRLPAVTLRDSIERPEALDTGSIVMTGVDAPKPSCGAWALPWSKAPSRPSCLRATRSTIRATESFDSSPRLPTCIASGPACAVKDDGRTPTVADHRFELARRWRGASGGFALR